MLKNADASDFDKLKCFLSDGIISLRILSYITAYGFDKNFFKLWYSADENGISAVISLFENSILIKTAENADMNELSAFLTMLSFDTLSCEKSTADLLGFSDYSVKQGYIFLGEHSEHTAKSINENDLKGVYKLISERIPDSFGNSKEEYLSFLSDYTFRARRNLARGKCVYAGDALASCAVTSAETDNKALISGVASNAELQGGGYGKRAVLSLVNELKCIGKTPYVIALNDSAKSFYEHLGFEKDNLIAYINRKDI